MAAGGNTDQIAYIVQAGCLKPLCDLLVVKETKIVSVILEAITNILHVSSQCVCILYNMSGLVQRSGEGREGERERERERITSVCWFAG